MTDLISRRTRNAFREFMTGWVLRDIDEEFEAAGLACEKGYQPQCSGQRRTLIEQYYHAIDFGNPSHIQKLFQVYETVLLRALEMEDKKYFENLAGVLGRDGYEVIDSRIVPIAGREGLLRLKGLIGHLDYASLRASIKRMEEAVNTDPALAIGSSKELVEDCCKTILMEHGCQIDGKEDLGQLVKKAFKLLKLLPSDIPDQAKGVDVLRRTLSNLASVVQGIAELRNLYGTGHGKDGRWKGATPRHAALAVGVASSLAHFLFATHMERSTAGEPLDVNHMV